MNKERIEKVLRWLEQTLIEQTYSETEDGIMFCAVDNSGCIFEYWLCEELKAARRKLLSGNMVHDYYDCTFIFFEMKLEKKKDSEETDVRDWYYLTIVNERGLELSCEHWFTTSDRVVLIAQETLDRLRVGLEILITDNNGKVLTTIVKK